MVELPAVPRWRLVIVFVMIVALVGIAAFVGGRLLGAPQARTEAALRVVVPVDAAVEDRVVAPDETVQGAVSAGEVLPVVPAPPADARVAVAVAVGVHAGDEAGPGTLLGDVSGSPVLLLRSPIPFFRDLAAGDTGADVTALQQALTEAGHGVRATGRVDSATLRAVRDLYSGAGVSAPPGLASGVVDTSALVTVRTAPVRVVTAAGTGDVIDDDHPLVRLQATPDDVTARVTLLGQQRFAAGTAVDLVGGQGFHGAGTVVGMSAFQPASDAIPTAGYDIAIAPAAGVVLPPPSTPVSISSAVASPAGPAVPTIALHQDARGGYVLKEAGSPRRSTRVPVEVIGQADGWAAIRATGLVAGDRVVIQ